ncbi:MAG: histidine kinase [Bacteroidota bacterium]
MKKVDGKACDTCATVYFLDAEPDFSYLVTGVSYMERFSKLLQKAKRSYAENNPNARIHLVSNANIDVTFLPNFLNDAGKRTQLYRNFGGDDYNGLEFKAEQNGKTIKQWAPMSALAGIEDHVVYAVKYIADKSILKPWQRTFYAGNFKLAVNDTLKVTVRNIATKKIIREIVIARPEDKATNFLYYELKIKGDNFSGNLQQILNNAGGPINISSGDTTTAFEKDDQSVGLLRFNGLNKNDELQYSFEKDPYKWQIAKSESPEEGTFIVLGNDLPAGTYHDIYLRYASEPQTIHKITVFVKAKPYQIPWGTIALVSIVLLIAVGVVSYTLHFKNKIKLALLKQKSDDTETRLSLLNGQLNPHFLYNSLNAIQGTINSDTPDRANAYIASVAAFMRNVMDSGKKEFVSLQEELNIEEDYLKLEQQRATFTYAINVAPGLDAGQIDFPPLLLQPVLENSIRHAFNADNTNPAISINIAKNGNNLLVEVNDNGSTGWDVERMSLGHGLSLTKKRMAVYNDKLEAMNIQMQIKYQPKGTVTTFTFNNWLA